VDSKRRKSRLIQRGLEIVSAVVAGYSNKEIAEYFKIAEDAVKHHLATSSTRSAFQRGWNSLCLP
jgi:DNA-binding CsgD family transcriptional regulator